MADGSEKRNRQLAFELQYLHVCEERSNQSKSIVKPFLSTTGLSKTSLAPGLVKKLTKMANLVKIRHGFGKYSNRMPKLTPWRVAIMTKMANLTKIRGKQRVMTKLATLAKSRLRVERPILGTLVYVGKMANMASIC